MEVEYSLTVQDMEEFLRYHQEHGHQTKSQTRPKAARARAVQNWLWMIAFVIVTVYFWFTNGIKTTYEIAWPFLFLSGALVGGSAMLFLLMWKGRIASVKKIYEDEHSRWIFSPRRLAIGPESITSIDVYEQAIICWAAVWRIIATEDHIFLYTTANAAQIVPRRAFRDQQHFEEFLALARQYQQGGGQQAPKPTGIIAGLPPQSDAFTRPEAP